MADSLPIPYKHPYYLHEIWGELTKSSAWKAHASAKATRAEAAEITQYATKKIAGEAASFKAGTTHTYLGNTILMVVLNTPALIRRRRSPTDPATDSRRPQEQAARRTKLEPAEAQETQHLIHLMLLRL